MYKKTAISILFGVTGLLVPSLGVTRVMTTEEIICPDNVQELQRRASMAYLVELSNVENGGFDRPYMGVNGILYSPAQMTILKIYRDSTGELAVLKNVPQKAVLARLCDSAYNEREDKCWALQMVFENKQRWVLFDIPKRDDRIDFTLRDCPGASFLVESDEQLKAWEEKYH